MQNEDSLFGHPKGLYVLFFTELWERFSYYGMRAILVLYIYTTATDDAAGGLGWTKADALILYGWYTMAVYVMSIPGGILADRFLGQKKTVMLGGILLCMGHGILAAPGITAFYTGLILIILGVGALKPNISTMVGGLYKAGDERRDKGFTIFYIGINIGAFLAGITVAVVASEWGWHYGFGLAGIGMLIGQLVYIWGQKYLTDVGNFVPSQKVAGTNKSVPLSRIEKDRVIVLLLSFIIIIVFWGAFEQAGGLMNIYANDKIDRMLFGYEIPAGVFQSVNAFFIMIFGTAVAGYWVMRRNKNKENSSIFKMAIGTIIMGLGFLFMTKASMDVSDSDYGKAGMIWLVLAYLFHTIGELCASPVALSFITKLAPVKYASIMMGLYFAASGFGNKVAGVVGEATQEEPATIELIASRQDMAAYVSDDLLANDKEIKIRATLTPDGDGFKAVEYETNKDLSPIFSLDEKNRQIMTAALATAFPENDNELHATFTFNKDIEAKKVEANKGDGKNYSGPLEIVEIQNKKETKTFTFIALFTVAFGLLLWMFLKKLKALTHGAEDKRDSNFDETEGFELADKPS